MVSHTVSVPQIADQEDETRAEDVRGVATRMWFKSREKGNLLTISRENPEAQVRSQGSGAGYKSASLPRLWGGLPALCSGDSKHAGFSWCWDRVALLALPGDPLGSVEGVGGAGWKGLEWAATPHPASQQHDVSLDPSRPRRHDRTGCAATGETVGTEPERLDCGAALAPGGARARPQEGWADWEGESF